MFRIVTAIFILALNLTARAEHESSTTTTTNQPTGPSSAEALMAAMSSQQSTNQLARAATTEEELRAKIDLVRTLRFQKSFELAEKQAGELVIDENPAEIRRLAMLELAYVAQDAGELPKAQVILGEYVRRHQKDPSLPEVCLRQGLIYRQMGAQQQALVKFYQVMNH